MDPFTTSLLIGAASKGLGSLFGGGTAPQVQQMFTPEMAQQAFDYYNNRGNVANIQRGTPSYAPGTSVKLSQEVSPREVKTDEYIKYLVGKGYTPEYARVKASKGGMNKDKGFRQYAKTSDRLSVANKKVKGKTEFTPGGVDVSPQSEALRQGISGLGLESLAAASGLPSLFGQEAARALGARGNLANLAMSQLAQPMTEDGLTASDARNLEAIKAKYLNDFGSLFTDTMRGATSSLVDSGFSSSNLAGESLKDNAYNAQSDFLVDAMAKLAGLEDQFKTSAASRRSQGIGNILGAFGQLGATGGIGSVTGGLLDPASAGLFNDVSSASMANQLLGAGLDESFRRDQLAGSVLQQPVTPIPEAPGFLSTAFTGLAPALGLGTYLAMNREGSSDNTETVTNKNLGATKLSGRPYSGAGSFSNVASPYNSFPTGWSVYR